MKDFMRNFFNFLHRDDPKKSVEPLLRYIFDLKQGNEEAQILQV
jgi:hypothetical protein